MKIFFALLFFAMSAGTVAASQDDDFMTMRQAFQNGDASRVAAYAQRLRGHVLEPYAIYYQLYPQLENIDVSIPAVKGFLERYKDSPLSGRLQGEWLKSLGKAQQWELFAEGYPDIINKDTELTCHSLQYRIATNDASAFAEARPLWFNARDMPESCTALFDALDVADDPILNDKKNRDMWFAGIGTGGPALMYGHVCVLRSKQAM